MIDAAAMRNVATPAKLEAFARVGGGVAGEIEVIPLWESWRVLVVATGGEAAEGTVGRVGEAISRAARRWAATHISVHLKSRLYGKQLHHGTKGRWQRGAEKDAKPPIMAYLSKAVSPHGVDLWLDAFCLRGHVGEIAVKKAVEAVIETKLKQQYPGLLAGRRGADAPSSTVAGAGPPDLAPPNNPASAWGSGRFSSSGTASLPSRNTTGPPAAAAAGWKTSAQSSAAFPARTRQTAGAAVGHVGFGSGSCGDVVGAFPTFSFGTVASGPPARAWDMGNSGNFAIAAGSSPATRGVFGAPAPAGAGPKMLTPTSVELPAGTGDGAAGTSSAAAPPSAAAAAAAAAVAATATAGHVSGGSSGGDGEGAGAGTLSSFSFGTACRPPSTPPRSVRGSDKISNSGTDETNSPATAGASGAAETAAAAAAAAVAEPKKLAPSSSELPAETGDDAVAAAADIATADADTKRHCLHTTSNSSLGRAKLQQGGVGGLVLTRQALPSNGVVRPNVLTVLPLGLGSEGFPSMCSLTNLKLVASNNVRATAPIKRSAARKFALFSAKVSRFVEFFRKVFGEVDIVVDEAESVVRFIWGRGDHGVDRIAGFLEHGIRVCREGPWQAASFTLVQVRVPICLAESGRSPLLLSAGVPHPSNTRLTALSAVYGIVTANLKASYLKVHPPPPPPPPPLSSIDGAAVGLSGAQHRGGGLPRSFAPPSVDAASGSVMVAQLWGLHDSVQAALDRLVVGPDKRACQEQISLRLGQRNVEQLASTGWVRDVGRRGAKVELYQHSGTIRVTYLDVIAAPLAEALPRSVQLVDMIDAAAMRNVATPAKLEAFARVGEGVAGEIEVIPLWESWRVLVVATSGEAAEGTVGRVRKTISQAVRRWAATHISVHLQSGLYDKHLHHRTKVPFQRGAEKDAKPPIVAYLSQIVSPRFDLWLDAFCLRGHVGEIAVKKAIEAMIETKLKQQYPGLLAGRRGADAPSSTV
ncbi:unnamed protein product, partial [Ectocarpus fasciculatus]